MADQGQDRHYLGDAERGGRFPVQPVRHHVVGDQAGGEPVGDIGLLAQAPRRPALHDGLDRRVRYPHGSGGGGVRVDLVRGRPRGTHGEDDDLTDVGGKPGPGDLAGPLTHPGRDLRGTEQRVEGADEPPVVEPSRESALRGFRHDRVRERVVHLPLFVVEAARREQRKPPAEPVCAPLGRAPRGVRDI